jgi:hypothetical protein
MATIDTLNTTLRVEPGRSFPTITPRPTDPVGFKFRSPTLDAYGSMRLKGRPGEDVSGWTLGFIQLKFIATNYSRYRGRYDRDGSMLVTENNQIVCRDTDDDSTEVWYDSLNAGGDTGPDGTNQLDDGTIIPPTGFLDVPSHLYDRPKRFWASVEENPVVRGNPDNFLYHTDIGLAFCTMLVAQDPDKKFHMLKHFYWNVRWEQMFVVDASGTVVQGRTIHLQHNIQQPVHSGNPMDKRFYGKEYDLTLPVSNIVSRRPARTNAAPDWRHM